MIERLIELSIWLPVIAGLCLLLIMRKSRIAQVAVTLAVTTINLAIAVHLFRTVAAVTRPWCGFGLEYSLRLYQFSGFILAAIAAFAFLIALYSASFMRNHPRTSQFFGFFLLSVGFSNGAVLADNFVLMLFFWEALIVPIFGLIVIGGKGSFKTAVKTVVIVGLSDLCMMVGIALCGHLSGTLALSNISLAPTGLAGLAFILLIIGAISKAGSMPFHTWIPDAAIDAPLPFMALLPAALEKLLGIYLLARISLDLFTLSPDSWASTGLMTIGSLTILAAVAMALIQKDYKRLLSYHAISQVGYMILGIGTLVPAGIVGGLFHMINHAMYKSCLFLTGGAVEKQAGSTDLARLGGLGRAMPVTFTCFIIAAASISGVPPFNGFFSKELVYDGALERGWIFYAAAALGSFLTAASFLKLGHASYLGKRPQGAAQVREASIPMLVPMIIIAGLCVVFGLWNALPLNYLIQPILGHRLEGHSYAGFPTSAMLVIITIAVLLAAVANHLFAVRRTGSALKASDHIHYAPVLRRIYDRAEKGQLDPYNIGMGIVGSFSRAASAIDRAIDWIYDVFSVTAADRLSGAIRKAHTGSYRMYMIWSFVAFGIVAFIMIR